MFSILQPITRYFKIKAVRIYDNVFGLHSQVTVAFLVGCTIIVSAREYFGRPIDCISDEKDSGFVSSFCWVNGTYILDGLERMHAKRRLISFGVGQEHADKSNRNYQLYYPWIVLFLVLQAIMFLTPAYLWRIWEGGRLRQLCDHLNTIFAPEEWSTRTKSRLVSYFAKDYKDIHLCYALKYFFCEFLNCLICIFNIVLLNIFFTGFWYNFGPAVKSVLNRNWDEWNLHSSRVFPKMAKCDFRKIGASGSMQNIDVLCLLPLNILNEKLFAFLWCWFILLTTVSVLNVIYRIFVICSRKYRMRLLQAQLACMPRHQTSVIANGANIGDWFLLYQVGRNINASLFRELMEQLYQVKKSTAESVA